MRQILIDIDGAWKTMCGECCYLQPTATGERGKWCDIFCVASDIDATDMPPPRRVFGCGDEGVRDGDAQKETASV